MWSDVPGDSLGLLIGGLENGEICLWNADSIVKARQDAVVLKQVVHSGPIRGLDLNLCQPNLLASGSTDGEVIIIVIYYFRFIFGT